MIDEQAPPAFNFQPRRPIRYRKTPPAPPAPPPAPPSPPVARVTAVDRVGQYTVRFTFDTAVVDLGACGDLRVDGNPPSSAALADAFNVDATYTDLSAGPHEWTTEPIDGEPTFASGATIATDSGPVPPWV